MFKKRHQSHLEHIEPPAVVTMAQFDRLPIEQLPTELVSEIFCNWLTLREATNLTLVCNLWRSLVWCTRTSLRVVLKKPFPQLGWDNENSTTNAELCVPNMHTESLQCSPDDAAALARVLHLCRGLKSLSVETWWLTDSFISTIFESSTVENIIPRLIYDEDILEYKKFPPLHTLSLIFTSENKFTDLSLEIIGRNCPSLLEFRLLGPNSTTALTEKGFKSLVSHCNCLETLQISAGTQFRDSIFTEISALGGSLKHLDLSNCLKIKGSELAVLIERCTNLESLRLGCPIISRALQDIPYCSSLKALTFCDSYRLDCNGILQISEKFPVLSELCLFNGGNTESGSEKGLYEAWYNLKNLKKFAYEGNPIPCSSLGIPRGLYYLSLDSASGIGDGILDELLSENPNLEYLKLADLVHVNPSGYAAFSRCPRLKVLHLVGRWRGMHELEHDPTWFGYTDEILKVLAKNISVETLIFSAVNSFSLDGLRYLLVHLATESRNTSEEESERNGILSNTRNRQALKTLVIGKSTAVDSKEAVLKLREEFPHVQIGTAKRVHVSKVH